jgi:hypothetical protein
MDCNVCNHHLTERNHRHDRVRGSLAPGGRTPLRACPATRTSDRRVDALALHAVDALRHPGDSRRARDIDRLPQLPRPKPARDPKSTRPAGRGVGSSTADIGLPLGRLAGGYLSRALLVAVARARPLDPLAAVPRLRDGPSPAGRPWLLRDARTCRTAAGDRGRLLLGNGSRAESLASGPCTKLRGPRRSCERGTLSRGTDRKRPRPSGLGPGDGVPRWAVRGPIDDRRGRPRRVGRPWRPANRGGCPPHRSPRGCRRDPAAAAGISERTRRVCLGPLSRSAGNPRWRNDPHTRCGPPAVAVAPSSPRSLPDLSAGWRG